MKEREREREREILTVTDCRKSQIEECVTLKPEPAVTDHTLEQFNIREREKERDQLRHSFTCSKRISCDSYNLCLRQSARSILTLGISLFAPVQEEKIASEKMRGRERGKCSLVCQWRFEPVSKEKKRKREKERMKETSLLGMYKYSNSKSEVTKLQCHKKLKENLI